MRKALLAIGATVLAASACAPKLLPAPVVTAPKFPDFVEPVVPADAVNSAASINEARGWAFLQTGDLRTAEREFSAALRNSASFYPAEISLGYVELARKEPKSALPHFERGLEMKQDDLSALLGRGQALLSLGRDGEALTALEAALAADPSQTDVRQRVDVLHFKLQEQGIARARELARTGQLDQAAQAYGTAIAGSPDSPFLYREVAAIDRKLGHDDEALQQFRKAVELDPSDARSLVQIGEILEAHDDSAGAEEAYARALTIEPDQSAEGRLTALRERDALAQLPAEYRAIDQAPQINRADLAALIGIRLASLLQSSVSSETGLITDVRGSWAASWIIAVARAGVMEPYANHAFQPRTLVRRIDLAQAVARLLARVALQRPAAAKAWDTARVRFGDLSTGHLAYPAASVAVASGVMQIGPDNAFQPSRVVTGGEAIAAIDAVARISGKGSSGLE